MGALGLALCLFLTGHLAGNLLIFLGPKAFNGYAKHLEEFPLLIPVEIVLLSVFLLHVAVGVWLTIENWLARPQAYEVRSSRGAKTFASSTMIYTGAITFAFLIIHLLNLKFAPRHELGLYGNVIALFQSKAYSLWYVFAVCVAGTHVYHGFQSAFRSIGLHHPKYTPELEWVSRLFGVAVAAGYGAIPVWVVFFAGGKL